MEQIAAALKLGGWQRIGIDAVISMQFRDSTPPVGVVNASGVEIQIAESKRSEWSAPALALGNALAAEGVRVVGVSAFQGPSDKGIHIVVGSKE